MKASIRAAGIKSFGNNKGGLGSSELHGKRLDDVSQKRIITEANSINWSKAGEGKGLELVEAFKAHKKEFGAVERGKSEIGTHLLAIVSPEWIKEAGDIHDPNNPNTLKAIEEAVKWAESWQGKGSVFAYRFDLDEKGTGVVDLFTAPVFEQTRGNGKGKAKTIKAISPNMAKEIIVKQTGEKTSGAAFQTSWADWAKNNLDSRFERGNRKEETGRDHVHAEVYAREAERAQAEVKKQVEEFEVKQVEENDRLERLWAEKQRQLDELEETIKQLAEKKAELNKEIADKSGFIISLDKREAALEANEAKKLTIFNRSKVIQDKFLELDKLKEVYDRKYRDEIEQAEQDYQQKKANLEKDINLEKERLTTREERHQKAVSEAKELLSEAHDIGQLLRDNSDLRSRLRNITGENAIELAQVNTELNRAKAKLDEQAKTIQIQKTEIKELSLMKKTLDFVLKVLKQHFPEVYNKISQAWKRSPENPKSVNENRYDSPSM